MTGHVGAVRALLPALLAVTLLVTGCSGSAQQVLPAPSSAPSTSPSTSPSGSPSPPASRSSAAPAEVPPPEAPRLGVCRRLDVAAATRLSNAGAPVSCRRSHTARTIHVGTVRLGAGAERAPDSARVQRRVGSLCNRAQRDFLRGDAEARRLSRFAVVWFTPTLEEVERGADWFRCDLVALGDAERLLRLPPGDSARGALDRTATLGRYGLCGTAAPGSRGFERVACALPHRWVAIGTRGLEGGRRYPGVPEVRSAGEACAGLVRPGEDVRRFDYGWEWPTAEQWREGQRHGFCWAPRRLA